MHLDILDDESGVDDGETRRRAVRFFWIVLIAASATSIAGNAIHAAVNATAVPAVLAAAVATAPPLVLLASTEGLSQLVKVRRHPSITYWVALLMTTVLAAAAFRLSFDALRDLAARCGIRENLAWLWPIAVDVTMTQATVSLLALTRMPFPGTKPRKIASTDIKQRSAPNITAARKNKDSHTTTNQPDQAPSATDSPRPDMPGQYGEDAKRVVATKRTKQSPEVVQAVLAAHDEGLKVNEIVAKVGVHHSTVSRIIANALKVQTVSSC